MVAAVAEVQPLRRERQRAGKAQLAHRLGPQRRRRVLVDAHALLARFIQQFGDALLHEIALVVSRDDLHQPAVRIDQRHRGPGADAVVLPGHRVRIARHRKADAQAVHRARHQVLLTLGIELGRVDADHGEAVGVLGLKEAHVGKRIGRSGRT